MIVLLLLVLGVSNVAFAQTRVTVNGVITDTSGNPATSGTVVFTLMPQLSNVNFSVAGQGVLVPLTSTCGIDGSGNVKNQALSGACLVWGNDVISPAGTTYTITTNPNGQFGSTVQQQCILGVGPYDMTRPNFCGPFTIKPQYSVITTAPFNANLLPQCSGCFNIGSASLPWGTGFFNTISVLNGLSSGSSFTAPFFQGNTANQAQSGLYRLPNTGKIVWRNAVNGGDVSIGQMATTRQAGCTTTTTQFNMCAITVTWPSAFADTNYTVACVLSNGVNLPAIAYFTGKSTTTVTVEVINLASGSASSANAECIAIHD